MTKKASPLAKMDSSFRQVLQEKGVGDQAITTLLREEICDMETFVMLRESHFAKLNERLSRTTCSAAQDLGRRCGYDAWMHNYN